jgi:hypothetical protein
MDRYHFRKWCNTYYHYIDEWYDKFIYLYNQHGYFWDPSAPLEQQSVPPRIEFYLYCYRNTRGYWDPKTQKKLPLIIMTPRKDEELMKLEQQFFNSPYSNFEV